MDEVTQPPRTGLTESARDALYECAHSAVYAAFQSPAKGCAQTIDQITGFRITPSIQFMSEPKPQQFGSMKWLSQQIGGAIGFLLPFGIVRKCVGTGPVDARTAITGGVAAADMKVAQSFFAGLYYDALLRPVETQGGSFWRARFDNAMAGAVSFGTMTQLSFNLKYRDQIRFAAQPDMVDSFARGLRREVLAGIPVGILDAHSRSWLSGRGFADARSTVESMISFGVIGGGMHSAGRLAEHLADSRRRAHSPEALASQYIRRNFKDLGPEHREVLLRTVMSETSDGSPWKPEQLLLGFKPKAFMEALDVLRNDQYVPQSREAILALRVTNVFGNDWRRWVEQRTKIDLVSRLDLLPPEPAPALKGLASWLLRNRNSEFWQLELVSKVWRTLPREWHNLPGKELAERADARRRFQHKVKDIDFATEAYRAGISADRYPKLERLFLASQRVPVPFPLEKVWQSGKLTGRFIPRSDARGLFLGIHSDCCQHPEGAGRTCATYGQRSINSGFFVVEDRKKNVVAQSWAWISSDGGLCFDSVEGKGLSATHPLMPAIAAIYKQAARDLSSAFSKITVGSGGRLNIRHVDGSLREADTGLRLPKSYREGYSDSDQQIMLAENPNADRRGPGTEAMRAYRAAYNQSVREWNRSVREAKAQLDQALRPALDKQSQVYSMLYGERSLIERRYRESRRPIADARDEALASEKKNFDQEMDRILSREEAAIARLGPRIDERMLRQLEDGSRRYTIPLTEEYNRRCREIQEIADKKFAVINRLMHRDLDLLRSVYDPHINAVDKEVAAARARYGPEKTAALRAARKQYRKAQMAASKAYYAATTSHSDP